MVGEVWDEVKDVRRVNALGTTYDAAIKIVNDYLAGKEVDPGRVEVARIMVAQWSKVRQTDNARAALNFMMQRHAESVKPPGAPLLATPIVLDE